MAVNNSDENTYTINLKLIPRLSGQIIRPAGTTSSGQLRIDNIKISDDLDRFFRRNFPEEYDADEDNGENNE